MSGSLDKQSVTYLLVQLEPCGQTFAVDVLQAEEPDLPQADGFDDLQKRQTQRQPPCDKTVDKTRRRDITAFKENPAVIESVNDLSCWTSLT